jgi:protein TonB
MRPDVVAIHTEGQRLTLALALALIVHALLIFGTRFTLLTAPPAEPMLSVQLSWLPLGGGKPDMVPVGSGANPAPISLDSGASPEPPAGAETVPPSAPDPAEAAASEPVEPTLPPASESPPAVTAQASPATPTPKAALPLRNKAEAPPARTVPRQAENSSDKAASPPAPGKALSSRPEQAVAKSPSKPAPSKPALAEPGQAATDAGSGRAAADKPAPAKPSTGRLGSLELLNRGLEIARNTTTPEIQAGSPWEKPGNTQSLGTLKNFYEENWARKVERLGSIPAEALRLKLSTGPTLAVAIRADGSVQSTTVLRSSGNTAIDEAARSMVEAAAPYAPFPPELRRQTSVLRIVRKWKFEHGRMLSD